MSGSASVAFEDSYQHESVALFASKSGKELVDAAKKFCKTLGTKEAMNDTLFDVGNLSSDAAMFFFCVYLYENEELDQHEGSLYLGKDGMDGDNSDHGHFVVNLLTAQIVRQIDP